MKNYVYKGNRSDRDLTSEIAFGDQRVGLGGTIRLSDEDYERISKLFILEAVEAPKSGSDGTVNKESSPSNKR